uniref:clathrin interactor EPSIN 2-like n=1 Tax=Erigeron canadensis TaxID=72917 RepID=UPI001CB9CE23|nr:clathrin interactor EPSIN 2-like [Erigeron canadensis]
MKKVFGQTVREIKRGVNKKVLKVPSIEQKILDATNNEPWGPHGTHLADIAEASRNYHDYKMVMSVVWKRINDTGKNWRHVFKALTVLEYLVVNGSERVIDDIRDHAYQISALSSFQYIDSTGRDQGSNVRKKSQCLVALVNDKEKLQEAREQASVNRAKSRHMPGGHGDEDRNGYGREREWGDDRSGRDGGRNGEDQYGRDGYKDDEYRGRSRDGYTDGDYGQRSRSSDRDRERAYEDDGHQSSRASNARVEDGSPDVRLESKSSGQSLGAPPSYEDAVSEGRSPDVTLPAAANHHETEVSSNSVAPLPASTLPPAPATPPLVAATGAPAAATPAVTSDKETDGFDFFDPRGASPAPPSASVGAELDLFGSLSDSFSSNALALVPSESHPLTNPNPSQTFGATSPASQPFDDPFGDGPFRAVPSTDGFSAQPTTPFGEPTNLVTPTTTLFGEPPQAVTPMTTPFGEPPQSVTLTTPFGESPQSVTPTTTPFGEPPQSVIPTTTPFGEPPVSVTSTSSNNMEFGDSFDQTIDILADILPPTGPSPPVPSQTRFQAQSGQLPTPTIFHSQTGQPFPQTGYASQPSQLFSQTEFPTQSNQPFSQMGFPAQPNQNAFPSGFTGQSGQPMLQPGSQVQGGKQPIPQPSFPAQGGQFSLPSSFPAQGGQSVLQPGFLAQGGQSVPQPSFLAQGDQSVSQPGFLAQGGQSVSQPGFLAQEGKSALTPGFPAQGGQAVFQSGFPAQGGQSVLQPSFARGQNASLGGFSSHLDTTVPQAGVSNSNGQPGQLNNVNGGYQPQGSSDPLPQMNTKQAPQYNTSSFSQAPAVTISTGGQNESLLGLGTTVSQAGFPNSNGHPGQLNNVNGGYQPQGSSAPLPQMNTTQAPQYNISSFSQAPAVTTSTGGQIASLGGFSSHLGTTVSQAGFPNSNGQPGQLNNVNGGYQPQGSSAPLPQMNTTQAPQYNTSSFPQQPAVTTSTGALAIVPQQPTKEKFETKSTVWADTLNRGLVNLNISGSKTNPLSDIGIDFEAINRKEKRMEKPSKTPVTSNVTMGKAMGSGSGMGRAGAGVLRPTPNPMVGPGMGTTMGAPNGGPGYGGVNQPMGMYNMPQNMGMGMNMGQGFPMQQQPPAAGFPPGSYNTMMGRGGGYGQQPYGGYR